jgi:hypothetical protein
MVMNDVLTTLNDLGLAMLPTRHPLGSLALLASAVVLTRLAHRLHLPRHRLADRGLLPWLLSATQATLRGAALLAALLGALAWLPDPLLPLLPLLAATATLAVGRTLSQWLPDLFAGLTVLLEGQLRPGHTLTVDGVQGDIQWIGLRSTRLRDATGLGHDVPNQRLLGPLTHQASPWPVVTVRAHASTDRAPTEITQRLQEIGALSPWAAPGFASVVTRDPTLPEIWHVTTHILELRFTGAHTEAVRRMADDTLGDHASVAAH